MSVMTTYDGGRVSTTMGSPSLVAIGVALGRIPRFCGHTEHWYPVLGHVLTAAKLLPDEHALHGLLHDAQESLTSDVPTPMKTQVARNREHVLLKRIYQDNGLLWPISEAAQEAVDEIDEICLIAEAHVLGHPAAVAVWGELDEDNELLMAGVELTQIHLGIARSFLEPDIASLVYQEAFEHYASLSNYRVAVAA